MSTKLGLAGLGERNQPQFIRLRLLLSSWSLQ